RTGQRQESPTRRQGVAFLVLDRCFDTRKDTCRRAGLRCRQARQRGDHDRAGLRLPPRIDDGTFLTTDVPVVPDPRLRVDRLANRSKQTQTREITFLRPSGPPPLEAAIALRGG